MKRSSTFSPYAQISIRSISATWFWPGALLITAALLSPVAHGAPKVKTDSTTSGLVAPQSFSAQALSDSVIALQWVDANDNEIGYGIERRVAGSKTFAVVATLPTDSVSFTDTGLSAGETYEYRAQALRNPSKFSSDYSETVSATTEAGGDTQAPTVALASPVSGTEYTSASTVNVAAQASDDTGIARVEFSLDGTPVASDTTAPYGHVWSFDAAANGIHTWRAVAYDDAGNASAAVSSTVSVAIDTTPPSVSVTSPGNGSLFDQAQTVAVSAAADDASGIERVDFYYDGALAATDTTAPYSHDWSFEEADNGSHTWTVTARDTAGNSSTVSVAVTVEIAPANDTPSPLAADRVVDMGQLGPSSALESKGRMAEFGDRRALLYTQGFSGQKWIYLWDDSGNESWVYLPELDDDLLFNGEYLLTGENELWLFSSNGDPAFGSLGAPAVARRYQLSGSGALPDTAELMEAESFGDLDSAAGTFISLESGALVGTWYHLPTDSAEQKADVGIFYRSPTGVWSVLPEVRVDALPNHRHRLALSQHPADGSVWLFSKGDSFKTIWAIHLSEVENAGLTMDWVEPNYISQTVDGLNGPEGELPNLIAAPDTTNGTLLLAYQNADYVIFSSSPFVKGAAVTVASIDADGSRSYLRFDEYVERVNGLNGLVVQNDGLWLAYRPIDTETLSDETVYAIQHGAEGWQSAQQVGTTYFGAFADGNACVAYAPSHAEFAITQNDFNVHLHTLN